jgi:hypothetical protein
VNDNAEHQREVAALGRREVIVQVNTPWGPSQGATVYAEGVLFHSTASHGGFHLTPRRNCCIHPALHRPKGFYEEDAEWAAVAQGFPDLFTTRERRQADETIRNHWPEAWERIHGRKLEPGESRERDRQIFECTHAEDWIVIAPFAPIIALVSPRSSPHAAASATSGSGNAASLSPPRNTSLAHSASSSMRPVIRSMTGRRASWAIEVDPIGRPETAVAGHCPHSRRLAPVVIQSWPPKASKAIRS